MDLVMLGGAVRPISMSTTGPLAEQAMRQMTADKVFTSGDGLVAQYGLCEGTPEQVALKSLMLRQAAEVFILADASKLGRGSQRFWVPLLPGWTLVTDAGEEACAPFRAMGLRILQVPLAGTAGVTSAPRAASPPSNA
jgi:DeoR/GlpR family transcriptional regulator of sugar metabolism